MVTDESFPQGNLCPRVQGNHPVGVQLQRKINHIQQEQWSMSPMNKLRASEPLFMDHTTERTVAAATSNEALRNLVLKDPSIGDRQHDHRAYLHMKLERHESAGANSEHEALQKLDQLVRIAQMDEQFIATVLSDGTAPTQFRHGQCAEARTTAHKRGAQEADPALRETALATGQRATAAGVIIAPSIASLEICPWQPGDLDQKIHDISVEWPEEIRGGICVCGIDFDTKDKQMALCHLPLRESMTSDSQMASSCLHPMRAHRKGISVPALAPPQRPKRYQRIPKNSIQMKCDWVAPLWNHGLFLSNTQKIRNFEAHVRNGRAQVV